MFSSRSGPKYRRKGEQNGNFNLTEKVDKQQIIKGG